MISDLDLLGCGLYGVKITGRTTEPVNRHVNLVYSAALQQLPPQLKADGAQSVYIGP